MDRYRGASVAILSHNNEYDLIVLMGFRTATNTAWPNCYQFPGGKIEFNEWVTDGLIREVEEECNLRLDLNRLIELTTIPEVLHPTGYRYNLTTFCYWLSIEERNFIMNIETNKNQYWTWMRVHSLIKDQPANVLPGIYETLRSI